MKRKHRELRDHYEILKQENIMLIERIKELEKYVPKLLTSGGENDE
jgi:hypothetical protein